MASQAAGILVSLGSIPILSRLLGRDDFGLVAMVAFFTGFANMFVDAGLTTATIQRSCLTRQQSSNLFWASLTLGLIVAASVSVFSPAISWFYSEPRLTSITLALAVNSVLAGLVMQHRALLRRNMMLGRIAVATLLSRIIGVAVAIAWAWSYYKQAADYWALVLMPMATSLATLLLIGAMCPWLPNLPRRGAGTRSLLEFGANLTGFQFLNYFVRNGDNLLIGWWWGPEYLGVYERAYKLFMAPIRNLASPLSGVMVPALSRLSHEPERYRRYYLNAVGKLGLFTFPLACFLFVAADLIVQVMLGEGWEDATPILRVLSVVGAAQGTSVTFGWLYTSQGRGADMLKWVSVAGPLLFLSFIVGLPWGPLGVAIAYAVATISVTLPIHVWYVCRKGPIRQREIYQTISSPLILGLVAGCGAAGGRLFAPEVEQLTQLILAASCGLALAVFVGILFPSTRDVLASLYRLIPGLPK